jgi:hypothetical protein
VLVVDEPAQGQSLRALGQTADQVSGGAQVHEPVGHRAGFRLHVRQRAENSRSYGDHFGTEGGHRKCAKSLAQQLDRIGRSTGSAGLDRLLPQLRGELDALF